MLDQAMSVTSLHPFNVSAGGTLIQGSFCSDEGHSWLWDDNMMEKANCKEDGSQLYMALGNQASSDLNDYVCVLTFGKPKIEGAYKQNDQYEGFIIDFKSHENCPTSNKPYELRFNVKCNQAYPTNEKTYSSLHWRQVTSDACEIELKLEGTAGC